MAFMFHPQRSAVSSRARVEAYVGLLLLLIGLTVLAFNRCGMMDERSEAPGNYAGPAIRQGGAMMEDGELEEVKHGVTCGNAWKDGQGTRGWWVGHFIDSSKSSLRKNNAVETKWSVHKGGEKHGGFSTNGVATSMAVLISGRHRLEFPNAYVILKHPGDYVIWSAGIPHSWTALSHSTILCIRWPSIRDDQAHNSSSVESDIVSASISRPVTSHNKNNNSDVTSMMINLSHPVDSNTKITTSSNDGIFVATTATHSGEDGNAGNELKLDKKKEN